MATARLDPLQVDPPAIDVDMAERLLAESWELRSRLTALHGERDLNFRVADNSGRRFVLKIHNPADGAGEVDFQTAAQRHIRLVAPDLPVGDVVVTTAGEPWAVTADTTGRRCYARLLTHLDGQHPDRDDLGDDDLFRWGRMAAAMGRALRGFFHPAAGYPIAWDVARLPGVREWTSALDEERRVAVLDVISRHEARVAPVLPSLRAQVVHNDLSRDNVLVDDEHVIVGITDFGDMTHTALVCDLAVAIADVLDGRDESLHRAEAMIAGYASVTPLEPDEANVLADLVAGRCAAALAIQAWRGSTHTTAPPASNGAWQLLQQLSAEGLDDVAVRFSRAAMRPEPPYHGRSTAELDATRARSFGPLSLSYTRPLHVVRGEGVTLYDADGRDYLDAYNNVPVLGHSHPAVTAAVSNQLRRLNTNSRYLQEAPVELAERLIATMPAGRFDRVLLVNSGSEANDLAWRIACFATGASGGIVTDFAYHGVTAATTALSPETWSAQPAPHHIKLVSPPDQADRDVGGERTIAAATGELRDAGVGVAAMYVDGVFTSDGILGPAHDWTRAAVATVHDAGGLYVADEVQAGYGRTGDHLWSFAASDLDVDIVTLGKPMGNGFPVAAVVTRGELVDTFMKETDYFSTFGGSTVACAAALAVLDTVESEGLTANARAVGGQLAALLGELAARHPTIAPPRGWGLSVGVDVRSPDTCDPAPDVARRLVDRMRERGVLIGRTARGEATLKIRPPLVFAASHAQRLVTALDASLHDVVG